VSARAFYFGAHDRRAFGWLHSPKTQARGIGVVLCAPLAYEGVLAHRSLRRLAERLTDAGYTTLRFDYHGTGDSDGIAEQPGRVAAWLANIADAAAILRAEGCGTICAYGLRAGALLATRVAADGGITLLALHAPVASGRHYTRELRAFRKLAAAEGLDDGSTARLDEKAEEAAGFVLWSETVEALAKLDLVKLAAAPCEAALFLPREDLGGDEPIAKRWTELGVRVTRAEPGGYRDMMLEPDRLKVPEASYAAFVAWLDTHPANVVAPSACTVAVHDHLDGVRPPHFGDERITLADAPTVRETPLRFGPADRLFGVVTEPERAPASGLTVLLLNPGSVHRIGSNRMHVLWARAWAALGYRVLRMDIGGIGDSRAATPAGENKTYSATAVPDVQAAMQLLAKNGPPAMFLVGLCSGAYVAFHTARVAKLHGAILINPQTFDYKDGDPLEVVSRRNLSAALHYQRSLFSVEKWKKLFAGDVQLGYAARVFLGRAAKLAVARARNLAKRLAPSELANGRLGADLWRVAQGTRLDFVYSTYDPGLDYLERTMGEVVRRLRVRDRVGYDLVDEADHTFTPPSSQRRLYAVLTARVRAAARRA
jgi:alpha/beta superfamily hydrolase